MEMNIKIKKTDKVEPALWTGGYATSVTSITVDKGLPTIYQQGVVIHEVVECYLPSLSHDKVVELTAYIQEGLKQLEEVNDGTTSSES